MGLIGGLFTDRIRQKQGKKVADSSKSTARARISMQRSEFDQNTMWQPIESSLQALSLYIIITTAISKIQTV